MRLTTLYKFIKQRTPLFDKNLRTYTESIIMVEQKKIKHTYFSSIVLALICIKDVAPKEEKHFVCGKMSVLIRCMQRHTVILYFGTST